MIPKKILTKEFRVKLAPYQAWIKKPFTADLFQNCKELLPTDIITNITYDKNISTGWGDEDETSYYAPVVIVTREVLETDEEYMERISVEERRKEEVENREYLEYLRLRAKYEYKNETYN
jgi:hypothetical protein